MYEYRRSDQVYVCCSVQSIAVQERNDAGVSKQKLGGGCGVVDEMGESSTANDKADGPYKKRSVRRGMYGRGGGGDGAKRPSKVIEYTSRSVRPRQIVSGSGARARMSDRRTRRGTHSLMMASGWSSARPGRRVVLRPPRASRCRDQDSGRRNPREGQAGLDR